jgi:type VI secretion system Hcp family effector
MAKTSQFLKITDKRGEQVLGECIDGHHFNEIDLSSWGWSMEDPAAEPKRDAAAAKGDPKTKTPSKDPGDADATIRPSLLSITKRTDRATHRLMQAMDTGEIFREAVLVTQEEYEQAKTPFYMRIELRDVLVVKLEWSLEGGDKGTEMKESWDLNYSHIEFSYNVRQVGGGAIVESFDRPRDSEAAGAKKAPLSAAEKDAKDKKRMKELGLVEPSKKPGK